MADDQFFQGRSALVTGGGSGIGLACATALARHGAAVVLVGRSEERLADGEATLRAAIPGAVVRILAGDAGEETTVERAVAVAEEMAPLAVGLANAGVGGLGPLVATAAEQFDQQIALNLRGTFLLFKHAGAVLSAHGSGALCAVSSIAGLRTHRFMGPYCASKAAVDMLVRNTADELGAAGVRVNSVCPGLVETELAGALLQTPQIHEDYLACMPVARHGQVEDVAQAVLFLCSPAAAWITGVNLPVDGGHHLRRGPNLDAFFGS